MRDRTKIPNKLPTKTMWSRGLRGNSQGETARTGCDNLEYVYGYAADEHQTA